MGRIFFVVCLVTLLTGCKPLITRPEKSLDQTKATTLGATANPSAICPVTRPPEVRFIPPGPYSEWPALGYAWYGTDALWTAIPNNGEWAGLPHNPPGYTQKVFWWREGYFWTDEPEPKLTVTGRRLDAPAPPLVVSKATNAFAADIQSAMLVGVDFPTLGCWEISGVYADAKLDFVVWVAP